MSRRGYEGPSSDWGMTGWGALQLHTFFLSRKVAQARVRLPAWQALGEAAYMVVSSGGV